ncbi:MAG: EamA family transporter [Fibrobacter sp.]|nr:EamA family transporter [Fibrobacter sp.]
MLFLLLTIGPAFLFACGNILEKSGVSTVGKRTGGVSRPLQFFIGVVTNKFWWLGIACSGLATVGYYIAMARYDLSQVQPMMVLNPVLTALMGFVILKEVLTRRIVIAICFVVAGLLYSVESLGEATSVQNIPMLWTYAGVICGIALVAHLWCRDREMVDSLIMGAGFGISAAFYKSLAMDFDLENVTMNSVLMLILDLRTLGYIATYGIAFLYSQVSFSRGRALFIIPFSAAVGAAVPTLAGVLVFSEDFPLGKVISVTLVLIGAGLFVVRRPRKMKFPK